MIDMTGVEGAVATPASELQHQHLHLCCAVDCEEKAAWVIMEKVPRTRPVQLKRTAGSVSVYCHTHVSEAEVADEELVMGHARTSEGMELYRALGLAWPDAPRMI